MSQKHRRHNIYRGPKSTRGQRPMGNSGRIISSPRPTSHSRGSAGPCAVRGVLELHPKGYGFLRDPEQNYQRQSADPYVPAELIRRYGMREGAFVEAVAESTGASNGPRTQKIEAIEGVEPERYSEIRSFDDLTPVDPCERIRLEVGPEPITMRVLDLFAPIGKGQRALIVAPPRTGKTILLQQLAASVSKNHPEMYIIMLLIDERPEEVTEMRRVVGGEVVASSMDREVESHVRLANLLVERAKRLAEMGREVFLLIDSLTRLARAHNKWVGTTGRTMSGGIDIRALEVPKRIFGTARKFDESGSLTVVGTALIETGSRMDEVIFQEFKGTGNMELVLDRKLADRRTWPAMDLWQSGTRKEEKLLEPEELRRVNLVRRSLAGLKPVEAMETLLSVLSKHPSNAAFLDYIGRRG